MRSAAALAAWFLLAAAPAVAQLTVNAEVSKSEVSIDEQIALSVTVAGPESSLPEPHIPALQSLSIYDSGRSQSLSIVNGRVSSSIVHTFVVIPRAVGKAVIPPITVTYKGQTVQTAPITITVGAPNRPRQNVSPASPNRAAAPQAARTTPDIFVTAELDKKKAFVNEQVTLSVRFYTGVTLMQSPQYDAPSLSGFLAEDLPPERHGETSVHGRAYYYSEIKTALFPAQAGRQTVGSARVKAVAPPTLEDPGSPDFFARFFQQGMGGRVVELHSDPVALTAEPLPEAGKPAGFSGAVGQFTIAAAVDRSKVKAGEAVNLTVTISGQGNLKAVGDPIMPDMPQMRVFDTVSLLNLDKKNDIVSGSKVFKTVVVARVSGSVTIPPIRFDYFDPARRAYRRAETAPITLDVAPGDAGAIAAPGFSPGAPRAITTVSQDLRYLKTPPMRGEGTRALEKIAFAGRLNALPFLIFLSAFGFSQYRRIALLDPAGARARGALRAAQLRLAEARRADPAQAVAALGEALAGYLAAKLGQPSSGLTAKRALELVRARKPDADAALLERVKDLWDELDMRRFAPSAANHPAEDIAAALSEILQRLDREVFR